MILDKTNENIGNKLSTKACFIWKMAIYIKIQSDQNWKYEAIIYFKNVGFFARTVPPVLR